jgi:predicted HTH transcriptional regulator
MFHMIYKIIFLYIMRCSSKGAAIAKCSQDTALRDINDLLARGALQKTAASGRSTSYELVEASPRSKAT